MLLSGSRIIMMARNFLLGTAFLIMASQTTIAQQTNTSLILSPDEVSEEMVAAANAMLATVDTEARRQVMLGISKADLMQMPLEHEARRDWSYWPRPRSGLSVEYMTTEQRKLTHDLLSTLLSSDGHGKVVHIMQLDEVLWTLEDVGLPRGAEKYFLSIFGTPSLSTPWAWRFEGHHVSLSVTVAPGGLTVTPSFFGADPSETFVGPLAGFRPLRDEEDIARDLVRSLTPSQREIAVLSDVAPNDIFSTNANKPPADWESWRTIIRPEGIQVADLSDDQRVFVKRLVEEIVERYRPEISEAYLETINLDELRFAWMGSVERREKHYYRLQGAGFMFEFDNAQDNGNHIHSVWRNPNEDFGDHLLAEHYRQSH